MNGHDPKLPTDPSGTHATPYANTDEEPRGFSNDDDKIVRQQMDDVADPNQDVPPLPDPGGERHAAVSIDDDDDVPSDTPSATER